METLKNKILSKIKHILDFDFLNLCEFYVTENAYKITICLLYLNLFILPIYIFLGNFWSVIFLFIPFVFVIIYNAVLLKRPLPKFIQDILILTFLYLLPIVILI